MILSVLTIILIHLKTNNFLILFLLSIFLELLHLIVPNRGFEIKDLAGNILGVGISLTLFLIIKLRKKNE